MKNLITISFVLFSLFIIAFIYNNKLYYPPLPMEHYTKREVVESIHKNEDFEIELTREGGYYWFIFKSSDQKKVNLALTEMLKVHDWKLKRQIRSIIYYTNANSELKVEKMLWAKHYTLVKVPSNFK